MEGRKEGRTRRRCSSTPRTCDDEQSLNQSNSWGHRSIKNSRVSLIDRRERRSSPSTCATRRRWSSTETTRDNAPSFKPVARVIIQTRISGYDRSISKRDVPLPQLDVAKTLWLRTIVRTNSNGGLSGKSCSHTVDRSMRAVLFSSSMSRRRYSPMRTTRDDDRSFSP